MLTFSVSSRLVCKPMIIRFCIHFLYNDTSMKAKTIIAFYASPEYRKRQITQRLRATSYGQKSHILS